MNDEIVPYNPFSNLSTEDIVLPRLQLVQPTSSSIPDGEKHIGEWYNSVSGEFYKSLQAVVLGARAMRVMFPKQYDPNNAILCSSADAVHPNEEFVGMLINGVNIPADCKDCPFSQWTEDEDGKRVRPACDSGYLYAALSVGEKNLPFSLNLRGSGMAEAKRLNFTLMSYGVTVIIEISSMKKTGNRGLYYIPQFKVVSRTPADLVEKAVNLSKAYIKAADDFRTTEPLQGDSTGAVGQTSGPVQPREPEPPAEDGFVFGAQPKEDDEIPF
jgi:hypothetical protein